MSGYSDFNYDQMTLLKVEVHSDELELLQQVADVYDWKTIQTEVEPKFKEAAFDFRPQKPSDVCPHQDKPEKICQRLFLFWPQQQPRIKSPTEIRKVRVGKDRISSPI